MASASVGPMPGSSVISSGVAFLNAATDPKWRSSALMRVSPSPGT